MTIEIEPLSGRVAILTFFHTVEYATIEHDIKVICETERTLGHRLPRLRRRGAGSESPATAVFRAGGELNSHRVRITRLRLAHHSGDCGLRAGLRSSGAIWFSSREAAG